MVTTVTRLRARRVRIPTVDLTIDSLARRLAGRILSTSALVRAAAARLGARCPGAEGRHDAVAGASVRVARACLTLMGQVLASMEHLLRNATRACLVSTVTRRSACCP